MVFKHDTHLHLELLLQQLEILPKVRELENPQEITAEEIAKSRLVIESELEGHRLVIQSTVSSQNFQFVYKLFGENPKIKFLLGKHPEAITEDLDLDLEIQNQTEILASKDFDRSKILGIGEVGLDYFHTEEKELKQKQQLLFEKEIHLALENNLPVVIHCRDAFDDLIPILKNFPKIHDRFLIHCFTGDTEVIRQILDLGGFAAFGGIVTFGASAEPIRQALKYCPVDRFMLETDLPFLAPAPHRGQTNYPKYIDKIAEKAAEIKNLETLEIWRHSWQNLQKLFGQI